MKHELKAYAYKELDSKVLSKELKEVGMVFVHLPKKHALKYINLQNYLPGGNAFKGSFIKRLFSLISGLLTIASTLIFHYQLYELVIFQAVEKVRVCCDIEKDGLYRLTFS